jgi:hypothetical protein
MVWLADGQEFPVYQWDGIWDLSPLARPGRVLAWVAFADQPEVTPSPLARRTSYRGDREEGR